MSDQRTFMLYIETAAPEFAGDAERNAEVARHLQTVVDNLKVGYLQDSLASQAGNTIGQYGYLSGD